MNCDQVFDVLTRGPFPTGDASDASVEHHLRACHECRSLAEALQPAVELLHEAIAPGEASGLPEYQGALARVNDRVAMALASRPTQLSVRRLASKMERRSSSVATYARFTAALVLFVALGSLVWGVLSTTKHPIARRDRTPARLDQLGLVTLASLDLPAECFPRELLPRQGSGVLGGSASSMREESIPPKNPDPVGAINQEALRCCTECHNATNANRAVLGTVATLHRSCIACHSL
jgi:hypothetical protein